MDKTIELLHNAGYKVRLSVTMMKNRVDDPEDIERVVQFAKENKIEQLSVRPVRRPEGDTYSLKTAQFVRDNELTPEQEKVIVEYIEANKDRIDERLMHDAVVYTFRGQNLCLTDCLTVRDEEEGHRQLIFYSNGMLTDSWTEDAKTLLRMSKDCGDYVSQKKREHGVRNSSGLKYDNLIHVEGLK